jgi:alpha-N-arabinofuranosidase
MCHADEVRVTVEASRVLGQISKYLTGFNIVYSETTDDLRAAGEITAYLRSMDAGILRFPGGEVTDYYHYSSPNYRRHKDIWQTDLNSTKDYTTAADLDSNVMDVNEFLVLCRQIGAEPILGINIESGLLFGRVNDSINEAVDIVKYCNVTNNHNVKYWYLSNESYGVDSAHYSMTVKEYAEQIKAFSKAMRAVDPNIKLIVNWDNKLSEPNYWAQWEYLLEQAGAYFDIADVHWYWDNGRTSWDNWLAENPLKSRLWCKDCNGPAHRYVGPTYVEEIRRFHKKAAAMGRDIKLASLEWNIGRNLEAQPSPFQCALMQSEMLGQFIEGGLHMATMWPLSWHGGQQNRFFLDNQTYKPRPTYEVFRMYKNVLGQQLVPSQTSRANVRPVSVLSRDGKTLWVYLLHKSGEDQTITAKVDVDGFVPVRAQAITFTAPKLSAEQGYIKKLTIELDQKSREWQTLLPAHSLTMLTFHTAQ